MRSSQQSKESNNFRRMIVFSCVVLIAILSYGTYVRYRAETERLSTRMGYVSDTFLAKTNQSSSSDSTPSSSSLPDPSQSSQSSDLLSSSNLSPSSKQTAALPISTENQNTSSKAFSMENEMSRRRSNLQKHCEQTQIEQRTKSGPSSEEYLMHIIVSKEQKFMFCFIPKIANTNFRRLFLYIHGIVAKDEIPEISGDEVYYTYADYFSPLKRLGKDERTASLQHYKKVVFVRDPLERLLSGYRNKMVTHPNLSSRRIYTKIVQQFYKDHPAFLGNINPFRTNINEQPFSFREFLVFWTDSMVAGVKVNAHFAPLFELTNPCMVKYDYIGRYETLQTDTQFIFKKLGFDVEFPIRKDNYSSIQTSKLVKRYYTEIPDRLFKKMWHYLSMDSILFDYPLPKWALDKLT